jgi:hypothetical protein
MDIDDALDTIKSESLKVIKDEFKALLAAAKKDKSDFIKKSAEQLKQALIYRAEGKLSTDDVETLLRKQKKIAQIEANNAKIELLSRIQKICYRLLDIAIDVLVKAIVPVA